MSAAVLAHARRLQESIMTDVGSLHVLIEVERADKRGTTTTKGPAVWTGPALVQGSGQQLNPETQGQRLTVQPYKAKLPWNVEVEVGMVLVLSSSADPWLVGRDFNVTTVYGSSLLTCRYFEVEEA